MKKTEIGAAGVCDLDFIAALEENCFSLPFRRADFESMLSADGDLLLIAKEDGAPRGYLAARTVLDETEILAIAVDPAARGRGIGRALLDGLIERRGKQTKIVLEVRASNAAARALYAACGFVQTGVRRGYYQLPPEDAVLYFRGATAARDKG